MSERRKPSGQRLSALYRYISALEQSDLETLAAVLHEASHDPALSALLEEVDAVYQASDGTAVSELEARQALRSVLAPGQNGHLARDQQATFLQHIQDKNKETFMKEQETLPLPRIQHHRRSRWRGLQLFAALLVACVLIVVGALLINTRAQTGLASPRPTPTATSSSTQPLPGIVVAIAGGDIGSTNAEIYGLRPDNGQQVWTFVPPKVEEGRISGRNLIVQGKNVYALLHSQVYALQATDGKLLWHANLLSANSPQDNYVLLSDGNMLYIGAGPNGSLPYVSHLVALRPTDGSIVWQQTYQSSDAALLGAHNGNVYLTTGLISANNNQLRVLRGSDGTQIWAYSGGEELSVIADDTSVYLFAMASTIRQDPSGMHKDAKVIIALNVQNGHPRWSTPVSSNGTDQIQLDQNRLFLNEYHNNNQEICSWSVADGHQVWCHSFSTNPVFDNVSSYLVANGTLYAVTTQDTVIGTTTVIAQGTVVSRRIYHEKTTVQAYDASDGQTKQWSTTLNDWATGNAILGDKQMFVATQKYIWALDQRGNIVWNYQAPSQDPNSAFINGFYTVVYISW